jgi:DNA-binding NarL/FixJ family response regulator
MDGRDVLACIKTDADLKMIPTVVLTSSEAEADVVKAYQLHANCYLRKPAHFEAFASLVKSLIDFWLSKADLPSTASRRTTTRSLTEPAGDTQPATHHSPRRRERSGPRRGGRLSSNVASTA